MQRTSQSAKRRRQPVPKGIVMEPSRFVLVAVFFLVLGLLLGWFMHSSVTGTRLPVVAERPGGTSGAAPSSREIQTLLDHVAQAEVQVQARPGDLEVRTHLGNLYYDLSDARESIGDGAGARQAFLRAIENYEVVRQAGAASADVLTDLGTMYYRSGQPEQAVKAYEDAIAKDANHKNAWMNLGIVKRNALNDATGARQAWEHFLKINPIGPDADRVRTLLNEVSGG